MFAPTTFEPETENVSLHITLGPEVRLIKEEKQFRPASSAPSLAETVYRDVDRVVRHQRGLALHVVSKQDQLHAKAAK
jgi:hypothetical protein